MKWFNRIMRYWLMAHGFHETDFQRLSRANSFPITPIHSIDERINEGDIIYLVKQEGIYAWGYLLEKKISQAKWRLEISRGDFKKWLVSVEQIQNSLDLAGLLSFPNRKFTFLTNKQVKILNSLIATRKPPFPNKKQFIYNQSAEEDEGLHIEYKEVKPNNIPNEVYEFAVAYARGEGGSIYFGVRDKGKIIIGMTLNYDQRDQIKKNTENKLFQIKPPLTPSKDYSIEWHQVIDEQGNEISNLYVFEVEVKSGIEDDYETSGGKVYEKNFNGRRRIK